MPRRKWGQRSEEWERGELGEDRRRKWKPSTVGPRGKGRRTRGATERHWADWAVPAHVPASPLARQPACPGTWPGPVHPTPVRLRSLQASWPASPEPPKPPNSTTPVSPFHHLFSPLPSSPATVHLLIHEALISSLFNFVLNRLTGMITTCSAALPSPTNPVF